MIESVAIFRDLPAHAVSRLEKAGARLRVSGQQRLFAQGDKADEVFAILSGSGHVRIGSTSDDSKAFMVELFQTGDMFGEIAAIDGHIRTADAQSEGELVLLRIPAGVFMEVVGDTPALGLALSRMLARRLRRTFELLQDATFETLEVRLARQLLYLGEQHGRRTQLGLRLAGRFRQGDLADLLGATARSVITILNAWRASGLVYYDPARGSLTISDRARLRERTARNRMARGELRPYCR